MKHGLCVLTMPVLWLLQISFLMFVVVIHILAAPIRAFIYWGRSVGLHPGWRGFNQGMDDEFGIGVAPRNPVSTKEA